MNDMTAPNSLEEFWMPFTANKQFKEDPRLLVSAEGLYYKNHRGDKLLDSCSGLFCVALGHGRREIREAVANQLATLDYSPPFQFGNPQAFELARRVARLTPGDLNRVFFTGSGSEAIDTAMKIALMYHRCRGQSQRQRFVGRERAYHGVNFGGISVGGMVKNREAYGIGLPGCVHMRHTWLEENRLQPGQGSHGADLADDLQRFVELYGADTIAACFVEPIAGSTGILVPPQGYLERLRAICDQHGILLVFDEVICGFGRTGKAFGAQSFGVTPDIMTMAKALTNGCIPMGAVAARERIYDTVVGAGADGGIEFFHGYTYSAHPTATAAGIASLDIFERDGVFDHVAALAPYFLEQIFALQDLDVVADIRGYGLLAGIDLKPGDKPGERGFAVLRGLYKNGMVSRVTADTLILSPPLVSEKRHIDEIADKTRAVLGSL